MKSVESDFILGFLGFFLLMALLLLGAFVGEWEVESKIIKGQAIYIEDSEYRCFKGVAYGH